MGLYITSLQLTLKKQERWIKLENTKYNKKIGVANVEVKCGSMSFVTAHQKVLHNSKTKDKDKK